MQDLEHFSSTKQRLTSAINSINHLKCPDKQPNLVLLNLPAILRCCVQGTEGTVWLCTDEQRNCMVAVKLIPRGPPAWRLSMVAREGRMLARLGAGHINIVRPLEAVLTTKHLAFISEYVPGMN